MQLYDFVIVGSGPAACGALKGLSQAQKNILVIDIGLELKRVGIGFDELKSNAYRMHDIKHKTLFGFKPPSSGLNQVVTGTTIASSEMVGGYASYWGAVCERLSKKTLEEIGIKVEDPEKFYAPIADLIPNLQRTQESSSDVINQYLKQYDNDGIWHLPNLACKISECVGCRLCFYGCPLGLIHDLKSSFWSLSKPFDCLRGAVFQFKDLGQSIEVIYIDVVSGEFRSVFAKKVLLGAGPIESSKIIARSAKVNVNFELCDNAYTIFPFASFSVGNSKNTLCELVAKIKNNGLFIKAQLYTGSPYISNQIKKSLRLSETVGKVFDRVLMHIGILQIYVDSDVSQRAFFSYDSAAKKFSVVATKKNLCWLSLYKLFFHHLLKMKLFLLPFPKKLPVLNSMHFGAVSFLKNGQRIVPSCDDGSIELVNHVHMIDASVFKKMPACSPTETIIANAFRIAAEVSK